MNDTTEIIEQPQAVTPMALLQVATEQGADIDKLTKLMDLQERWEANEAKKAFVVAKSKFQADCPKIEKTKQAHNSKYAGLAESIAQFKSVESSCGLSHDWKVQQTEAGITVSCHLTHIKGHTEICEMSAEADTSGSKNSIQAIGSTNEYLKRYTLFNALGISAIDEDDDGAGSSGVITKDQAHEIETRLEAMGSDKVQFCKHMKVDAIAKIPAKQYGKADNALRSKEKKNANS